MKSDHDLPEVECAVNQTQGKEAVTAGRLEALIPLHQPDAQEVAMAQYGQLCCSSDVHERCGAVDGSASIKGPGVGGAGPDILPVGVESQLYVHCCVRWSAAAAAVRSKGWSCRKHSTAQVLDG